MINAGGPAPGVCAPFRRCAVRFVRTDRRGVACRQGVGSTPSHRRATDGSRQRAARGGPRSTTGTGPGCRLTARPAERCHARLQRGGYLAEAVGSVLTQSYRNIELILVDDGSTDSSGGMCDEFARSDKRVRVIHKRNAGLGAARNTGIAAARGRYLVFIDSDDYVLPGAYEALIPSMRKSGSDLATGNVMRRQGNREYQAWNQSRSHATVSVASISATIQNLSSTRSRGTRSSGANSSSTRSVVPGRQAVRGHRPDLHRVHAGEVHRCALAARLRVAVTRRGRLDYSAATRSAQHR